MSDEKRPYLNAKNFGDGMPMLLKLNDPRDDAPWFWSNPSAVFEKGTKETPDPCWLLNVTGPNGTAYTLSANLKMMRAIASMEQATGPLGNGATFTLERTSKADDRAHYWNAVQVTNPNPPGRLPINPTDIMYVPKAVAGAQSSGGAGDQLSAATETPGAAAPASNGDSLVNIRDAYRAPWSKKQASKLWDMAAEKALEHIIKLSDACKIPKPEPEEIKDPQPGEVVPYPNTWKCHAKTSSLGTVADAFQSLVSTYVIMGQKVMHPQSFGDEGPMPESILDRYRIRLDELIKAADIDHETAMEVIAMTFLEGTTKFGRVLVTACGDFDSFEALVINKMEEKGMIDAEDDEVVPDLPPATGPDDGDIPF